ncbi:metallophosphoesterase family protein [Halorubrum ezzemoulense]|uniref:metallophosphoesterase family protein n=1 Tax=Halorubrum ezzemoulense TaxID=337243 RepID=UPI00232B5A58|nr:metallophosphoesterase [Halorubrum ezzemoulense]MDB2247381.1 metallophosphoesterase [Halorubrum ezzemoulense]
MYILKWGWLRTSVSILRTRLSCQDGTEQISAYDGEIVSTMASGNELLELYDSLSVLYNSLPEETDVEWKRAVKSVLYGGELLAEGASSYGKQQNRRNNVTRKEYVRQYGNGSRVTEFSAITVAEPRPRDLQYVPSGVVIPVAPESGEVLPVHVSKNEVDQAISLLAEFPPEPTADRPGDGVDVLLDPARVRRAQENTGREPEGDAVTVLFVSDTHLGYENRAVTGSGKTVSWISEVSSTDAFTRIATIAIEQDVDAVIHTGDIVDHEVDQETLDSAASRLELLSKVGIPVYCIIGSHDRTSYAPQHENSVNGIAWLQQQVRKGTLVELSTSPTPVAGGPLDAYGISAGNTGIDDVAKFNPLGWEASDMVFGSSSPGPNVLCLHDGVTPYRSRSTADVDVDQLLTQSNVSFDCVLVGDEHHPKNNDFDTGYTFEAADGTPVLYTGPALRITEPYRDRDAFVTELSISTDGVTATRHTV